MAEDKEAATARYIASNVSAQLLLKTLFETIATMRTIRTDIARIWGRKLLETADTTPLAPMVAAREKTVRAFIKKMVGNLLINQRPN
jgi:hypothetical protein